MMRAAKQFFLETDFEFKSEVGNNFISFMKKMYYLKAYCSWDQTQVDGDGEV